ncbi:hypothetical protein B5G26_10640 [Anaerotignum lactatifermentans]|uniref:RNA polymerase sigma-70 region 2 domain-containing protein n=1 Tax=Anaerotignum lactatifermentans TaxID=160404 RepID=A0A1Y3U8M1_9FIRM|nr:sigma-70 family RNA polymerase sigma factor [Anaerotignum lactatifermentans]OUN41690.1 hypothetical protein B5G26_10640 [Anaerotignum lactatifermentans]
MQEKNIIDAIKAGDEQAMQKIICRYSRLLWSIVGAVLSQVGTTEDMEECVADVFIDLWEHPQKYDESRGGLKAWLSVIARNKAIDRYRQKNKDTDHSFGGNSAGARKIPADGIGGSLPAGL